METHLPVNKIYYNKITGLTLKSLLTMIVVFILLLPSVSYSQTAPILIPTGGFSIEGDLKSNFPTAGVGDWVVGNAGAGGYVLNNDGSPFDPLNSGKIHDNYDGNDMIFQGSKFNQDPGTWVWTVGKANSKNDINNVLWHMSKDVNDDMWIILGSDRFTTSGTSYIDFEFLQNTLTRNENFGFNTDGPHGGRTINDMVVSIEYSNGGSTGIVRIYLWKPVGSGYDYVEQTIPGGVTFAATNTANADIPFGAFGLSVYTPYQFAEAAVNISDLFGAIDPCLGLSVRTIIVKTKASTSLTANLGDFAEPFQVSLSLGTADVSYNNALSLCPAGTVLPQILGITGGTFTSLPSGLSLNPLTGEINLATSTPGNYTITYSFITNGCPRTVNTDVTILSLPQPPVSASVDLPVLCFDYVGDISLTATGGSGTSLNWYTGSCGGVLVGSGSNLVIPAPGTTTTYYAAWTNSCGISSCEQVTVTVLPQINISTSLTAEISFYNGSDAEITITATGGSGNYTYSLNGGTAQSSNVFSGLSSGTYSVVVTDDQGCDAVINVNIPNALQIIANDDSGSANGMTGGTAVANVLINDLLNGTGVDLSLVNISFISSTDPAVSLVGTSVNVAVGTPAGTYNLVYEICEIANPTNCDQATVTVTVTAAAIIANDDTATGVNGYTGVVNLLNVFDNDLLNGSAVNPTDVILTETVADPTGNLTLNPDGSVDIDPGTPAGNYSLTYQICEVLNPTNCDNAIVEVTVIPATIIANDDSESGVDGTAGQTNILNVFDNDLLNGNPVIPAEVILSLVTSDPTGKLTLNPDGSVDIAPFTPGGTYTLTYQICEVLNPTNCDQAIVTVTVIKTSDISIVKSHINPSNLPVGSPAELIEITPSVITAGTKIYYFLNVENFGPDNSVNATITDILPAGISNPEYSLNFGNSWFAWGGTRFLAEFLYPGVNYVMIRGDVDPSATGTLVNTATIYSANTTDPDLSNNESTVITTIESSADLNLTKIALTSPVVIGGQIVYQINVTNLGPSVANDVVITDIIDPAVISSVEYSIDGGSTWLSPWTGSLNIGSLATFSTFSVRIRGVVIDNSPNPNVDPIPNTASVIASDPDPDPSNNEETIYTPLNIDADVSIVKSGPASVIAGQTIQYSILVTNNSNTFSAESVHIHDVVNSLIISSAQYSADGGTTWFAWTGEYVIGDMIPLSSFTLLIRGTVLSSVTEDISNTAIVESDTPDSDLSNNTSTIITDVELISDLEIVKIQVDPSILPLSQAQIFGNPYDYVINPIEITAGEEIYYVLFYANNGPSDATNVIIDDVLPGFVIDWEASRCQANYGPWTGSGNLGTIIAGGQCVIVIRGFVEADATGNLVNTAIISDGDGIADPDLDNNESTFVTPIIAMADLSISKIVNNSTPYVGDNVNFTITVTNNGPSGALNVVVTDLLPNGYTYVSHTTLEGTFDNITGIWQIGDIAYPGSASLVINVQVNLPGGNYLNKVKITSYDTFDPDTENNEDEEITNPVNVIIAVDDFGGPVNGYSGANNILNVFGNDLINGSPVIPAELILTESVPEPNGYLTLNADGSVDVNPGTPAGTHQLTYMICEVINPTNCDDAVVTITVDAAQIIANDDFASGVNGYDGQEAVLNVFDNDLLNGELVIPAEVILTETVGDPTGSLTLNSDGTVDVAAGTPAGTYNLTYQICEVLNPTNCDDAIVTITINATQIIANDDFASGVNGYDGQENILNVFDNDLLNGNPVIPTEVILTETVADPTGNLILNADGSVDIEPGTPEGTYTLTYLICEVLNPTNCDDAIVSITVSETSIIANDDFYASVNGYVGQSNVLNVFDNDLLNGNPVNPVEVILTETVPEPNGYLILNPDGSVDVIAGIPAGNYSLTYIICEVLNPTNCDDAIVTIRVEPPQIIAVEDNASGVNGFAGETDVLNVFDNDLLNGAPVDPFEVTLEETVPEPNGYLVLNPDGSVDVLPGTPAGTYSLIYEICEIMNTSNCSDAPVFITVLAAVIAANDDNFSSAAVDCETGGVAGNVLTNDYLDGLAVNSDDVIITLVDDGGITGAYIDTSGDLVVPAGVAVGSYLLEYSICEIINPTNCDYAFITVVIEDTELPTITCPDNVAVNSDAGTCEATNVVVGTPLVNDNCGVNTVTGVRDDMLALTDPYPLGTTTITWTVTDFGGNSASCDQLVTVTDIELPTIVCPAPVAVNTDADECTASGVVLGTPTVDDNCTVTSVTNDAPVIFPIGITTVTWTVTDGSGNIATCEQLVTVTDIELPTIVCPAPVEVNSDAGECTASGVVLGTPTVDDNCSIASVTNDAPVIFPIGNTTVIWTVTDGSGNIATCEQIVTVTDIELPTITCPIDLAVNTDTGECTASGVFLGTPTVDDNCTVASVTNDAPVIFPIGNTTVIWTVTDGSGNIATCEQIVTVTDIELPTITCPIDLAVNTDAGECTASGVVLGTPTVDDNCTVASVTNDAPAVFPIGTTTVTWTVTDGSGNIATCEQLVTVTDIELPTITCPIDLAVNTDAGECTASGVVLGTPTVEDNCTVASVTNDAPAIFPIGNTTVTWTVTDGSGNIATCEQIVTVTDAQLPVIICPTDVVSCLTDVVLESPQVSDNCGIAEVSNNAPAVFPIGQTAVLWTVTDVNGNIAYCEQLVKISSLEISLEASSQVSCFDSNDGSIMVTVSGTTSELSYSLNGGAPQSSNYFSGLSAGEYIIVATDENGCYVSSEEVIIINPEKLAADIEVSFINCFGADDATITVNAFGGTGYYTYRINGSVFQSENIFTGLTAGTYSVVVSDANGCTLETEVSVSSTEALTLTYLPHCRTGEVGVDLFVEGGTAPYQYSIDGGVNFGSGSSFEGLINGTNIYLVVSDANGCTTQAIEVPVESLNTLSATVSVINHNNCEGINDAVVEVNVYGGVAPYIFTVNGTDVTESNIINNLAPGDNVITIRDSNGCPATTEAEIFAAEPIMFELISKTNADCNGNNDGTAEIEVIGGTEPYIFEWSNGSNQSVVANLGAGTHIVTVTDINGCEKTYDIIIDSEQITETPKLNNVFTPNNDGQNDYLVFGNLELFPENELVVFNRWGNEVYSRTSYNNLWDGSNLSEGTYFYILKVKMCDEYKIFDGYITILR